MSEIKEIIETARVETDQRKAAIQSIHNNVAVARDLLKNEDLEGLAAWLDEVDNAAEEIIDAVSANTIIPV